MQKKSVIKTKSKNMVYTIIPYCYDNNNEKITSKKKERNEYSSSFLVKEVYKIMPAIILTGDTTLTVKFNIRDDFLII